MNNKLKVVQLANYAQPKVEIQQGKEYVTFGKANSGFKRFVEASRGSVTNGSAIKSITNLVYGAGLKANNAAMKPEQWAGLKTVLKDEDIRRLAYDLYQQGNAAIEIIYSKDRSMIAKACHMPVEKLAAEKAQDGEIEAYYYAWDWKKVRTADDAERIPAFGMSTESREILYIKPYEVGEFYYSLPVWFNALQWAELEEEIANYHLSNIRNGLAPSMFISMNGGIPESEEEMDNIAKAIERKYTGSSNAGKFVLLWSESVDSAPTITPIPLSDASEQYQFLSEESSFKIVSGHRIPSPLLLGIPTKSGFSSNAEEIKAASILLETYVINPQRQMLIEAFNKIQSFNGWALRLEMESLNPFEEEQEATIQENMSKTFEELTDDLGEYINEEEWELIDEREVDYDLDDDFNDQVKQWNDELNEVKLASTGTARPRSKSEQDEKIDENYFITRYVYSGDKTGEREFCNKMIKAGKVYRKEDIEQMGNRPVNAGFGQNGASTYDIWLYKGGPRCHHKWLRRTYMSTMRGIDPESPTAKRISTNRAENRYGYRVRNEREVAMKPNDMRYKGFHPDNPNKPVDAR